MIIFFDFPKENRIKSVSTVSLPTKHMIPFVCLLIIPLHSSPHSLTSETLDIHQIQSFLRNFAFTFLLFGSLIPPLLRLSLCLNITFTKVFHNHPHGKVIWWFSITLSYMRFTASINNWNYLLYSNTYVLCLLPINETWM